MTEMTSPSTHVKIQQEGDCSKPGSQSSLNIPKKSKLCLIWPEGYITSFQRYIGNSILLLLCCCSVTKLCLILCNPMDCSTPGSPVLHISQSLLKFMSIESMMLPDHLNLCHPFLLLPSVFPSMRVFSNELVLCIRWPEY